MMRHLQLGASLYVPATRHDLLPLGNGQKYPFLRSLIFCTEDAIAEENLGRALAHLEAILPRLERVAMLRFIRVRSPQVLRSLLQMDGIERIDGFVLPKITRHNLDRYLGQIPTALAFEVMLTLETIETFDVAEMIALRQMLITHPERGRILSLRIGGNDLFQLLGMRRPRGRTLYETSLRTTIGQMVTIFRPHGFNLTAPVFEYLDSPEVLAQEVEEDLAHGLFGKTAIHPEQVVQIESRYRVSASDLLMADKLLAEHAPAVFRSHDAMCEVATHRTWASAIQERARLYGVHPEVSAPASFTERGKVAARPTPIGSSR